MWAEWLRTASEANEHGERQTIRAIIAPHAGFRFVKVNYMASVVAIAVCMYDLNALCDAVIYECRYSGPTAAHAYHYLEALERVKRVFILGPSHHFYLRYGSHCCCVSMRLQSCD